MCAAKNEDNVGLKPEDLAFPTYMSYKSEGSSNRIKFQPSRGSDLECITGYFEVEPSDDDLITEELRELNYEDIDLYIGEEITTDVDVRRQLEMPTIIKWEKEVECFKEKMVVNLTDDCGVKKIIGLEGRLPIVSGSRVWIHYTAFTRDSDEPFDSTKVRNSCAIINLGKFETIPGLSIALDSMKLKEISKFMISPEYGFGELGAVPRVPCNATLIFFVEMVHAVPPENLNDIKYMNKTERATLGYEKIAEEAEKAKVLGNMNFRNKQFFHAIKWYRASVMFLEEFPIQNEKDEEHRVRGLFYLYGNIAATYINLERPEQACVAIKAAIANIRGTKGNKVDMAKVYYKFAQAKFMLEANTDALAHCKKALTYDPSNTVIKELKTKVDKALKSEQESLTFLYKRMMIRKQDEENEEVVPKMKNEIPSTSQDTEK